jgi:hypothetical protein
LSSSDTTLVAPGADLTDGAAPQSTGSPTDGGEADTTPTTPRVVTVSVRLRSSEQTLTVDLDADTPLEPFGRFASCSGLRTFVTTYSVLVADPTGTFRSISVFTNDAVSGPGTADALVRVERVGGDPVVGTGTITLDPGLTSGKYLAFAPDGASIEGEFSCDGTAGPAVVDVGRADGVLDSIEVFALLRSGEAERILGLVVTPESSASIECPAAIGERTPVTVRVDGDQSVGAITTFELTSTSPAAMRLRAGDATYEFAEADVVLDDDATAGTFHAESPDGLTIDGAFRCT